MPNLGWKASRNYADYATSRKKIVNALATRKMLAKELGKGLVIPGAGLAVGTAGVIATND